MTNNWSADYEPRSFGERFFDQVLVAEKMEGDPDTAMTIMVLKKTVPSDGGESRQREGGNRVEGIAEGAFETEPQPQTPESKSPIVEQPSSSSSSASSPPTFDEATQTVSWTKEQAEAVTVNGTVPGIELGAVPPNDKEEENVKEKEGCCDCVTIFLQNCLEFLSPPCGGG